MDPNPTNFPILSYVMSKLPSMGRRTTATADEFDIEQPQNHSQAPPEPHFDITERMPHLTDPKVVNAMRSAVADVSQTRSMLKTLGERPFHELVDTARVKLAEIEADMSKRLEEIVLSPRPPEMERQDWRLDMAIKEDECRQAVEKEREEYKALIALDELHEAYEKMLRNSSIHSGPLFSSGLVPASGPTERGFMSGPIERGFQSGPLDRGLYSGPLDRGCSDQFQRSYSHGFALRSRSRKGSFFRVLQRAISKTLSRGQNSIVAPIKGSISVKESDWVVGAEKQNELTISSVNFSSECSLDDDDTLDNQNVQWAQGKAGEDRVHVVVSEEHGWVFVGIYDGFNGPDAPDFLVSNLYPAVHKELKGLLWDDKLDNNSSVTIPSPSFAVEESNETIDDEFLRDSCSRCVEQENYPSAREDLSSDSRLKKKRGKGSKNRYRGVSKKWEENQRRWRCEWDRERLELDRRLKEQLNGNGSGSVNHADVLKALSQALKKTEEAYLDLADRMNMENPELALMGSCVLVMLMKGEDVYVMNVGDSRAVLAQKKEPNLWSQDLERINEETLKDLELFDGDESDCVPNLTAFQLSIDHSTSVEEEVERIKSEHPDDPCALMNDRVKGSLKVTRAFGAGFLKQPKWNNALLEMFRIDYIGTSPYISCLPSLYHHRLGPRDRFLILSSDGLYQYFTNEEAVLEVEHFISWSPDGDPAQHLIETVLFRAAKKAGMEFHELLEIPQGDRRRYHDDVSIIVISLEGRIWRSSA